MWVVVSLLLLRGVAAGSGGGIGSGRRRVFGELVQLGVEGGHVDLAAAARCGGLDAMLNWEDHGMSAVFADFVSDWRGGPRGIGALHGGSHTFILSCHDWRYALDRQSSPYGYCVAFSCLVRGLIQFMVTVLDAGDVFGEEYVLCELWKAHTSVGLPCQAQRG